MPVLTSGPQPRVAAALLHLLDAAPFLQGLPSWAFLPRWPAPSQTSRSPAESAQVTSMDWQLARQANWPVTVERLADAVYGSHTPSALQQTRRRLRTWEQ
ncbi:hypothetical protein K7W42_21815 [Deinococcus sp. HMF7604]|uniref:hypothetical protein n=1 Tax=Deinococcus betulae TaxID=2873312 RepID=UPI001CCA2BBC|nr:hypothetical protein [Deinococcus betulae]MBZ9753475.1 hypothetical protein [Deinococcus betulae]